MQGTAALSALRSALGLKCRKEKSREPLSPTRPVCGPSQGGRLSLGEHAGAGAAVGRMASGGDGKERLKETEENGSVSLSSAFPGRAEKRLANVASLGGRVRICFLGFQPC